MNSAMMPSEGVYSCTKISQETFCGILKRNENKIKSYIGYQSTADFIKKISGVDVPISREQTNLGDGDEMLVVKLKKRIDTTSKKYDKEFQSEILDSDWEFFHIIYYKWLGSNFSIN